MTVKPLENGEITLGIKVLVDSSFLFLPLNCKIDILRETTRVAKAKAEFILMDPVYNEIESIMSKTDKPVLKRKAKFALEVLRNYKKIKFNKKMNESVDDCLVRAAEELKYVVATADMKLRKKLRERKIPVIYPREGSYLVLEGSKQGV